MLKNAGLTFEIIPADIDEESLIKQYKSDNLDIACITEKLAEEKAKAIAKLHPDALVIGSDQTLEIEGQLLSKANNADEAKAKLELLRGQTHILRSSVCLYHDSELLFTFTDSAELTMHDFDDNFLQVYMDNNQDALTSCVGAYKIEEAGAELFSAIKGDQFTIMGMPLTPLLAYLRNNHGISI